MEDRKEEEVGVAQGILLVPMQGGLPHPLPSQPDLWGTLVWWGGSGWSHERSRETGRSLDENGRGLDVEVVVLVPRSVGVV